MSTYYSRGVFTMSASMNPDRKSLKGKQAWNKGLPMSEEQKAKLSEAKKGFHHSEETRAKMSASKKGKAPAHLIGKPAHNRGKPMSDEQKTKLAEAKRGQKASTQTRAKMSATQKARYTNGYSMPEEARQRVGKVHRGKKVSEETKAKISALQKGKPSHRKDYTVSEETRKKLSAAGHARWERKSPEEKAKYADILRESTRDITNSWIEDVYASRLDKQGVIYERQKRVGWYRVDFFIPGENRIVEIQGCYWHGCEQCEAKGKHIREDYEKIRAKDTKRHEYLRAKGYTVDVVWGHEFPRKR